jgi:hypothetical protein
MLRVSGLINAWGERPMTKPLVFLALVQQAVSDRGGHPDEYLETAVRMSRKLPDKLSAEDAAAIFLRCLFGEPLLENDHGFPEMLPPAG